MADVRIFCPFPNGYIMSNEFDDLVILVDEGDSEIGTAGKMAVHYSGQLHRAFSVFIFTTDGRLLLQQRALNKYHSGGKWTNTCCSHPRPGEETFAAANRRLQEEMGLTCNLVYMFNFTYRAAIEGQLIEHEFDHVYFGVSDSQPSPNPEEASAYRYIAINDLATDLQERPEQYTEWLKICFERLLEAYGKVFNFNKQGINTGSL
jgi:isopentenyl-diphosphate delta-isomerase